MSIDKKLRTVGICAAMACSLTLLVATGCRTAGDYRLEADRTAEKIINEKIIAIGSSDFTIDRPSNILRRRLLAEQDLPYSGPESLGTDSLKPIEHWPDDNYPDSNLTSERIVTVTKTEPVKLSLIQALQIGAANSFEYQRQKEDIFKQALTLDLTQHQFHTILADRTEALIESDHSGKQTTEGTQYNTNASVSRKLQSGAQLTAELAVNLVNLLMPKNNQASSMGLSFDATISVPLLRGSGRHIVTEPLIQAQRNVLYSVYEFGRFRQTFAVNTASQYFGVLRQLDAVNNNRENYRGLIRSAKRSRKLADAGRITQIEVDQAVQNELTARNRWISALERYKRAIDSFKNLLGLPPDASIKLDRSELLRLSVYSDKFMITTPPADGDQTISPASTHNTGPLEINERDAIELAFENRFDLTAVQGKVYDAQRAAVVAADALGAELTLLGTSQFGSSRSISTANQSDARIRSNKGIYSTLLTLDLPFERTAERNAYRNSLIALEQAVRDVQSLEDDIKISIRNRLSDLLESRESLLIQAKSVKLAQKRVNSTNLFLDAGRAETRDLLESQEALLSAQNALTTAVINYRIAELTIQSDMGLLQIDDKGLWQEYFPGEN